ncbi:YceD family protein [Ruicaihuangia caeni]|uniref:DUF177 domain-containing protein n=1 Tax=Ruicaihuangia caeni TaxID=3042517 RepID=A0AAW6T2Z4_9MICO|nr:DUF177 domain-containing protein [Klugiella sp. YN-L-19]MDI2097689.1 DUF177 domain-containing protein [Klugiella sp. YN-L-19]
MSRPADSPYILDVYELMHRPGQMRERELSFPAPEQLGEGMISVKPGVPLDIDVRLEGLHEGILVSGDIRSSATGVCVRCLIDIEQPVQVEFQELFAYSSDEAFDYEVHDDHVDLEPVVRDAVVLSLPFQPVCRPDCPGLDPVTGERLADMPASEPEAVIDPRWAALEGFQAAATDDEGTEPGAEREKR